MLKKTSLQELSSKLASDTGISKQEAHDIIIETARIAKQGLSNDGHTNINKIGKLSLKWQKARPGRNPQTGESIEIPAHNSVHFKPAADLRKFINRKYEHLQPQLLEPKASPIPEQAEDSPLSHEMRDPIMSETIHKTEQDKRKKFKWWPIPVIVLLLFLTGYLIWPSQNQEMESHPVTANSEIPIVEKEKQTNKDDITNTENPVMNTTESVQQENPPASFYFEGGSHRVSEGERLRVIAGYYYKQALLWPLVFSANKTAINDPDILTPGMELVIPALEGSPDNLAINDKRIISEAFINVYLRYRRLKPEKALYYLWVPVKWESRDVIEKYKTEINPDDLTKVTLIDGNPDIND